MTFPVVTIPGPGGGEGVTVHNQLSGRSSANGHPISAITGLAAALASAVDGDGVSSIVVLTQDEYDQLMADASVMYLTDAGNIYLGSLHLGGSGGPVDSELWEGEWDDETLEFVVAQAHVVLDDYKLYLRSAGDENHIIVFDDDIDGPIITGREGVTIAVGDGNGDSEGEERSDAARFRRDGLAFPPLAAPEATTRMLTVDDEGEVSLASIPVAGDGTFAVEAVDECYVGTWSDLHARFDGSGDGNRWLFIVTDGGASGIYRSDEGTVVLESQPALVRVDDWFAFIDGEDEHGVDSNSRTPLMVSIGADGNAVPWYPTLVPRDDDLEAGRAAPLRSRSHYASDGRGIDLGDGWAFFGLDDRPLTLRNGGDLNHGLAYNDEIDGTELFGNDGFLLTAGDGGNENDGVPDRVALIQGYADGGEDDGGLVVVWRELRLPSIAPPADGYEHDVTIDLDGRLDRAMRAWVRGSVERPAGFPDVISITSSAFNSNTTSHAVDLPVADPGDLLVMLFTSDGNATVTTPSGWSMIETRAGGNAGNALRATVLARVVDDTDGTTIDVVTSAVEQAAAQVFRIAGPMPAGSAAQLVEAVSIDGGSTQVTQNPAELTPTWGSTDHLWILYAAQSGSTANTPTVASWPSGWDDIEYTTTTALDFNGAQASSAQRSTTAASEDPAPLTYTDTTSNVVVTIGIRAVNLIDTLTPQPDSAELHLPELAPGDGVAPLVVDADGVVGVGEPVGGAQFTQSFTDDDNIVVAHNLGRIPAVTVLNADGVEIDVTVIHANTNQFTVEIGEPLTGLIALN